MFVVGFATEDEIADLLKAGYDIEEAKKFGRVVGHEADALILPPIPSPSGTQAIAIFLDASVAEVVNNNEHGSYDPAKSDERGERRKPGENPAWPELPFDEEFLRIVLLQNRILGKDTTVEPFTSYRDELEWRRTDKHIAQDMTGKKLSVEQVAEINRTVDAMLPVFTDQKNLKHHQLRQLCSHAYADGKDASSGVPVSGERWCRTCGSQYD